MKKVSSFIFVNLIFAILSGIILSSVIFAEEPVIEDKDKEKPPQYAGSFFDTQVTVSNYYFMKGVIAVFGNKFGPQPTTPQETEDVVWEGLVLSYEAFRRGITVSDDEVNQEIGKILAADQVTFDWKKDKDAYEKWARAKANVPASVLEGQLKHLIQIQKLRNKMMEEANPPVSGKEAYQKFINEYSNLSVELVQFDDLKKGNEFYKKAKRSPDFWEKEKKKAPKDFKRPGAVSLEFLMDLWGFDKKASHRMMRLNPGQFYPPSPIYKGYGVFKVLGKRVPDRSLYPKMKQGFYSAVRGVKKHQALKEWTEDLKKEANIQVYPQGGK